jgi:glycosyltransferase involved in cell wall biosynthesis
MLAGEPVLEIAGSGPDEAALCGLAAQLKIESRVHFAGFQNDVSILLRNADAFVLSSRWEGLPVGILEAAAFGLPVVATNGAGTREAMLPGESGLLVPVGDSAALAEAMRGMMAMPEKQRKAMGKRGRQLVEERFSLSSVADQWERLYADLLESHLDPARWG